MGLCTRPYFNALMETQILIQIQDHPVFVIRICTFTHMPHCKVVNTKTKGTEREYARMHVYYLDTCCTQIKYAMYVPSRKMLGLYTFLGFFLVLYGNKSK